jgi:hypothetical protein
LHSKFKNRPIRAKFFIKIFYLGLKNEEFYADFEVVEKVF